jgi:sulfonate transport system substrate-binding protein
MIRIKTGSRFAVCSLAALSIFLFSGTACQQQPPRQTGPPEKITIAYTATMLSVLTHIAFEKGYFLAEGLEVTPQLHAFGKQAIQSVLEEKADIAVSADTPVMFAVAGGGKIYIVAVAGTSSKSLAIVARKDRGIYVPADLKGKRIGVSLGTSGDFYLDSFLVIRGIYRKDIKIIDMKPQEMHDALVRGKVDAVSIWNPTLKQIEGALKDNGASFYDEHLYSDIVCMSARQDFVRKNPETIRKVLKALIRAETFVKVNPEESKRIVAEFNRMDNSFTQKVWNLYNLRLTIDQSLIVSLEDQTRWAMKNRLTTLKAMPNYLDFIYVDGLRAVKPEAVRIIR